jgi:hypothetical protein
MAASSLPLLVPETRNGTEPISDPDVVLYTRMCSCGEALSVIVRYS